jgi:hypothetical protein
MSAGGGRTDKRQKKRTRRRIPCELDANDRRYTGIILDVSVDGLFVQTAAALPTGTPIRVRVQESPGNSAFELDAVVARAKRVPPQLVSAAAGGMGLRVLRAPAEFASIQGIDPGAVPSGKAPRPATPVGGSQAVSSTTAQSSVSSVTAPPRQEPAPAAPAEPTGPRFRVRLKQIAGNRSRAVVVMAVDRDAARKKALKDAGPGWDVLEVELVP